MDIKNREPLNKSEVSTRIKKARESTGLSQKDFAFLIGYKDRQYRKFEAPESDTLPSLEAFSLIAQLTNRSPGYLLYGVGPEFLDMESAIRMQKITSKALNIDQPNYGILLKRTYNLSENQLQLIIDLVPAISDYDPVLKVGLD